MKAGRKLCLKLAALAAALTAAVGLVALAAGAGSSTDPLVTVSYLEDTFEPSVTESVESEIASASSELESSLSSRISSFRSNLTAQTTTSTAASDYTTQTLQAGQTITVQAGTEILFLEGSATVSSAGITDATTGQTLAASGSMSVNHLYMATFECVITAAEEARFLIR